MPSRIPEALTSPAGQHFKTTAHGNNVTLRRQDEKGTNTIVIDGGVHPPNVALLGEIADAVGEAIKGVLKVMTCRMVTTTTVTCDAHGVVQKIETKTECAA
jgi:hypothetical protein